MKYETLITRYKNLGYEPKGVDDKEVELEFLIKWIYEKYDIFLLMTYNEPSRIKAMKKVMNKTIKPFSCHKIWDCNKDYANTFYSTNYFDTPYEAKFDTLREMCRAIRFQFH